MKSIVVKSEKDDKCTNDLIKLNEYKIIKELGRGAFGITYLVEKQGDDKKYVLKSLNIKTPNVIAKTTTKAIDIKYIHSEIDILKKINKAGCRKDILCYVDDFIDCDNHTINIITDAFENATSLNSYIQSYIKIQTYVDRKDLLLIMYNILKAMNFLSKIGIAHGDIKPDNILINEQTLDIQIIDFGLSCSKNCKPSGTLMFASPEILRDIFTKKNVSLEELQKSDVFSLGVVFFLLANLHLPYTTDKFNAYSSPLIYSDQNTEEIEQEILNNQKDYQTVLMGDQFQFRASLEKYYKTQHKNIFSLYNNDITPIDEEINKFIELMLRLESDKKQTGGRPSIKHLLSKLKKIIFNYNNYIKLSKQNISKSLNIIPQINTSNLTKSSQSSIFLSPFSSTSTVNLL